MFGVFMIATSAFSHRPFEPGVMFDPTEDLLHSITATAMGFAFAFGVAVVTVQRSRERTLFRALDVVALAASIIIPLGMGVWTEAAGLLQRAMFLVAYAWYATEAVETTERQTPRTR